MAKRILLVDDHRVVTDALSRLLKAQGYETDVAADGEQALAAFQRAKPDLVLLDRDLPKLSGSEVLKRLKALDPAVRVLVLSGHARDREKYDRLGIEGFLLKGESLDALLEAVKRILGDG